MEAKRTVYLHIFREHSSICVLASFPFGFEGGVWDLFVLAPDIAYLLLCLLDLPTFPTLSVGFTYVP